MRRVPHAFRLDEAARVRMVFPCALAHVCLSDDASGVCVSGCGLCLAEARSRPIAGANPRVCEECRGLTNRPSQHLPLSHPPTHPFIKRARAHLTPHPHMHP